MGIFDKLLNKKETLPPAPVSRVRPVSPGNGRKTREELRLECEILTKEAIHEASLYLAEKIIEQEARDMIDKSGQGITMHYSAAQAITEKEKADLVKEEDIENSLSHEVYSSRNLLEILKTIMTERGEKSAKELGKVIINYKELGGGGGDTKGLGGVILEELNEKRLARKQLLVEEQERLTKDRQTYSK